jgi:hypothetical protein
LQQSLDCVAATFEGAIHASQGSAAPRNISNIVNAENQRRIVRLYPTDLSTASEVDHIFKKGLSGGFEQ